LARASPHLLVDRGDGPPILGLSALFLIATACTFTSLGVILPRMRQDLGLSWSEAGLCFTCMALGCGATAYAPSWLIARVGVRRTAWAAAAMFASAFSLVGAATGASMLYAGCALAGFAFSLAAPVLGEFVIARVSARPAMILGGYYATGSMGGVIGPWLPWLGSHVLASWRTYWLALAAGVGIAGFLVGLILREPRGRSSSAEARWSVRRALRSPPLYALWASFLVFLAAESTLNTFAFAHLAAHGVSAAGTALFLSASALAAVGGRALGGMIADRFDAKGRSSPA
jgi:OFA family oxalate/formate antiporter-like MFS transporter